MTPTRKDRLVRMLLPSVESEIVLKLKEKGQLSPQSIAQELNKSPHQINVSLSRLMNKGFVSRVGKQEGVTKPHFMYNCNEDKLSEEARSFIEDFKLSEEEPEAAFERIRNYYEEKVQVAHRYDQEAQINSKLEKTRKLESEEAAEKFYKEALKTEDPSTRIEYLNKSILYARMTRRSLEDIGESVKAERMHVFEMDRTLWLYRLTDNAELLSKIVEESRSILDKTDEHSIQEKSSKLLQESLDLQFDRKFQEMISTRLQRLQKSLSTKFPEEWKEMLHKNDISTLGQVKTELEKHDIDRELTLRVGDLLDRFSSHHESFNIPDRKNTTITDYFNEMSERTY